MFEPIFLACLLLNGTIAQLPEPLQRAFAARQAMRTAHVSYRMTINRPEHEQVMNEEMRAGKGSYIVRNTGDDDGVMGINGVTGKPMLGTRFGCSPRLELMDAEKGEAWTHIESGYSAIVHSDGRPTAFDVRGIGMECVPLIRPLDQIRQDLEAYHPNPSNWHVEQVDDLVEVTAEGRIKTDDGLEIQGRHTWRIDPSKDFAVISLKVTRKMASAPWETWGECETQYGHIDGYWFPTHYKGWSQGNAKRVNRFEYKLKQATFDRQEHPKVISMTMLDIPAGSWVEDPQAGTRLVWDGTKSIPREQWLQVREVTNNRELRDLMARNQKADDYRYPAWWYDPSGNEGIEDLPTRPDEWEAYVRRWRMRYDVDDKQRTAARGVLDDCRKEARAVLDKRRPDLEKVAAQLKDAKLPPAKRDAAIAERERCCVRWRMSSPV